MTCYGASWSTLRPRAGQLLHEPATHEERCVHGAPATAKLSSEIDSRSREAALTACLWDLTPVCTARRVSTQTASANPSAHVHAEQGR